jgi:hypothetical protein
MVAGEIFMPLNLRNYVVDCNPFLRRPDCAETTGYCAAFACASNSTPNGFSARARLCFG